MTADVQGRTILGLLLVAHILLAGAYSVWNPLAEAPDEADHFAYVRYLAAERSLPSGPRVTQSKHPPLYHIVAAIAASAGDPLDYQFLRANPDVSIRPVVHWSPNFFVHTTLEDRPWRDGPLAFHMARLWSVLLSTMTVLVTYHVARTGFPRWPELALVAAGVLAFIPEFSFIGGAVNNDNGAALMGALIVWGASILDWRGGRWQAAWWTALAMGLGLMVKVSTAALWPTVVLASVIGAARCAAETDAHLPWVDRAMRSWRRWAGTILLLIVAALAIASPWWVRNWRLYGDPLGAWMAQQTIDARTSPWTIADTAWLLKGWFQSFWGKFGGAGHIPMPSWIYWTLGAICAVSIAGLFRAWTRMPGSFRTVLVLLLFATLSVAAAIWRYSLVALGTDQGRLLYPAVSAIVTLLVVGLAAWIPSSRRRVVALGGLVALAALALFGLAGVIRPAFAPPPSLEIARLPSDALAGEVQFGPLTLVGWHLENNPTLYWHAPQQPNDDWRTTLRVVAEDGSLVWEWRRSPGYGRWSSDHWPAGTVLRDEYQVVWPKWAAPGRYRIEVGAYPFGGQTQSPTADARVQGSDDSYHFLGWIERQ